MHVKTSSDAPSHYYPSSRRLPLVPVTRKFISSKKRLRSPDEVDKKLEALTRQVSDLQNRMTALQNENENLKVDNRDLQEENDTLRTECKRLGKNEIVLATPIRKLRRLATQAFEQALQQV